MELETHEAFSSWANDYLYPLRLFIYLFIYRVCMDDLAKNLMKN